MSTGIKVTSSEKSHLYGLDLLRLIAAGLVVFNHFGWFSSGNLDGGEPFAFPALNFATEFGWVGVEIFFVISGYVIALSARGANPSDFLKSRAVRIFPALWICSFVALTALATTGSSVGHLLNSFIRSAILFPQGPFVDGVVWSLLVEAVFYLLIWHVLLSKNFHRLDRVAAILGVGSAGFLSLYSLTMVLHGYSMADELANLFGRFAFKLFLFRYGVFFSAGMVLWLGFEYGFTRRRKALTFFLLFFASVEIAIQASSWPSIPSLEAIMLPILVWAAGMLALVGSIYYQEEIGDRLKRGSRLVKNLGLMTFPLYLNHYTLGRVLIYQLSSSNLGRYATFAIVFTAICVSTWFIMKILEPSLQGLLRKLLKLDTSKDRKAVQSNLPLHSFRES